MTRMTMTAIVALLLAAPAPARPEPAASQEDPCSASTGGAAVASSAPTSVPARSSAAFVRQALACGRQALHAAQEALALASSAPVRAIAARLVTHHRQANERLEALAQRKHWGSDGDTNIALPPVVDGEVPAGGVGSGQGADYDARFVAKQIDTQQHAAALFRQQSRNGDDPDARHLAGELLPVLEAQLEELRRLQA